MKALRLGVLAWPVTRSASVAEFGRKLDFWLAQARGHADLCMLPEYACVELGAALAGTTEPDDAQELAAMVAHADAILAAMRGAAMRAGLWLLPGTLPMWKGQRVVNAAPLIAPDGRMAMQQKHILTRAKPAALSVQDGARISQAPCSTCARACFGNSRS